MDDANAEIVELAALLDQQNKWAEFNADAPPPTGINDWLDRDTPEPDFLAGAWLHTASRALLTAPTGTGKTNFGLALAAAVAGGVTFLHWPISQSRRVLYVDGEMSRRLMRQRIDDTARRIGFRPDGLHILCHEDVENFAPLNTPEGQKYIDDLIQNIGGVDLIQLDNIMSLIAGNMSDEEPWQAVQPWIKSLTRRGIGQIWLHHTGHDTTRGYGTSTRTWHMDTVIHFEPVRRDDTDVSFNLTFQKARERTPETRADFADVHVALIADQWTWKMAAAPADAKRLSPKGRAFLAAFHEAMIDSEHRHNTWRAVTMNEWRARCVKRGLIDKDAKPHSARTLFAKHRAELIAADHIRCEGESAWPIQAENDV